MRKETGKADGLLLLTVFVLAGFGLLMLLMLAITFQDVWKIFQ